MYIVFSAFIFFVCFNLCIYLSICLLLLHHVCEFEINIFEMENRSDCRMKL